MFFESTPDIKKRSVGSPWKRKETHREMAMAMAMAMVRSGLRSALRGRTVTAPPKRTFSSSAHHDDAYETAKWEKITYAGIVSCTCLAVYCLSKGHPHHEEPAPYPYLRIRNKEFPWGPDGLFEMKQH